MLLVTLIYGKQIKRIISFNLALLYHFFDNFDVFQACIE